MIETMDHEGRLLSPEDSEDLESVAEIIGEE